MADGETSMEYFVRGADEKVFGPVDMAKLVEWAGDSRLDSTSSVSTDQKSWIPAPLIPELEMFWLVETEPGMFYGPFNRRVVDGLLETGTISRETRLYELDTGKYKTERTRMEAELSAKTAAIADLESRAAEQAATTKKTMAFMESKLAELTSALGEIGKAAEADHSVAQDEVFRARERAEAAEARAMQAEADQASVKDRLVVAETEIADLKAQIEVLTKFSAVHSQSHTANVIQPEVVISDMPPPRSAPQFPGVGSSAGLAALEAAAKRELAAAKKHGISFGGIFGGKK